MRPTTLATILALGCGACFGSTCNRAPWGLAALADGAQPPAVPPSVPPTAPPAAPPSAPPSAPPPKAVPPADESARLKAIVKAHDVPGLVACRIDGLAVTRVGAAGVRSRGGSEAIAVKDPMHLGSCTKAMTATLCAMLVRDGKLKWGSTLGEVFPERRDAMLDAWRSVRLDSLLRHRAGAPASLDEGGLWLRLAQFDGAPRDARLMLLDGVTRAAPSGPPGERFIYSNAGFAMAGGMAERVADGTWEDLLRTRVFEPIGMPHAGFGAPGKVGAAGAVDAPRGHSERRPVPPGPGADNPAAIGPAATVHAPIEEWAKFLALHVRRGRGFGAEFERLDWTALQDPPRNPLVEDDPEYAMGWVATTRPWAKGPGPTDTGRVLTHAGSNTMWYCVAWLAPERDFAVMACCNEASAAAMAACDEAVAGMLR